MRLSDTPGVGIVGCGLIGKKRACAIPGARLVACTDPIGKHAQDVALSTPGCIAHPDAQSLMMDPRVEIVVVATPNHLLAQITSDALRTGHHVLVEKPGAISTAEVKTLATLANRHKRQVRVGFNHRYHPAVRKAHELVTADALGPLMFLRGRYGHGGRVGYNKEWRADPTLSGGGELMDQGVHVIDLARWFLGDLSVKGGYAGTFFWDMPVDDNAFMLLQTPSRQTAFLHVSCTEWKNLFSLEIYGRSGKLQIDGLGGSYGIESLTHYHMLPEMGPPETIRWEYPRGDQSWVLEFTDFLDDIRNDRRPSPGLSDADAALSIVEAVYALSQKEQ